MARSCPKCGAPAASDQTKFCAKCGTALPAPGATASPPSAQPAAAGTAAAPAKSSGPWVKIIVGVLGFFVLVGILAMGTCAYLGYRLKQKVEQAKSEYGLDKLGSNLPSASPGSPATPAREACSLLTKEEVTEVTGIEVTEVHGDTAKCTYASATNPTLVETSVTWENGAMGYKMMVGTMKFNAPGGKGYAPITGIGDEACCTLGLQGGQREEFKKEVKSDETGMLKNIPNLLGQFPLMFRKGDISAMVGVSEARGDLDEAKQALAKKMVARL